MLDLAESSPEEIFQLLEESPNTSEAVQEIKQLMNQQFSEVKDPWLVNGLYDTFAGSSSSKCLDVLISGIREPHDKFLLEKICEGLRVGGPQRQIGLDVLGCVVRKQKTWLHRITQTNLMRELLKVVRTDDDLVVVTTALLDLVALMPSVPSAVAAHLQEVFEVFSVLAKWRTTVDTSVVHEVQVAHVQVGLFALFHRLYGMFPCNFTSYLRTQYSTSETSVCSSQENNLELRQGVSKESSVNALVFGQTIRPMLETVRMHPMLVTHSRDHEKNSARWRKMEHHDVVVETSKYALVSQEAVREEGHNIIPDSILQDPGAPVMDSLPATILKQPDALWTPGRVCGLATPPAGGVGQEKAPVGASVGEAAAKALRMSPTGTVSRLNLDSPPEAAIEATPETTPFVTPVKDQEGSGHRGPAPVGGHVARSLKLDLKPDPAATGSATTPLSPQKEASPFRFPDILQHATFNSTVQGGSRRRDSLFEGPQPLPAVASRLANPRMSVGGETASMSEDGKDAASLPQPPPSHQLTSAAAAELQHRPSPVKFTSQRPVQFPIKPTPERVISSEDAVKHKMIETLQDTLPDFGKEMEDDDEVTKLTGAGPGEGRGGSGSGAGVGGGANQGPRPMSTRHITPHICSGQSSAGLPESRTTSRLSSSSSQQIDRTPRPNTNDDMNVSAKKPNVSDSRPLEMELEGKSKDDFVREVSGRIRCISMTESNVGGPNTLVAEASSEQSAESKRDTTSQTDTVFPYQHLVMSVYQPSELTAQGPKASEGVTEDDLDVSNPYHVLDQFIRASCDKVASTAGGQQQGTLAEQLDLMQSEIAMLHNQVLYERHRRETLGYRNRRLLSKTKQARVFEEQNRSLVDQLAMRESQLEDMSNQLERVRHEKHEVEEDRAANAKQRDKEIERLVQENNRLKQEKGELEEATRRQDNDLAKASDEKMKIEHACFSALTEVDMLKKKESHRVRAETEAKELRRETLLLGEIVRKFRENASLAPQIVANENEKHLTNTYRNQVSQMETVLASQTNELDALKAKLKGLEDQLAHKENVIEEQKRLLEEAREASSDNKMEFESLYKDVIMINMQLESKILELNSQLTMSGPINGKGYNSTGRPVRSSSIHTGGGIPGVGGSGTLERPGSNTSSRSSAVSPTSPMGHEAPNVAGAAPANHRMQRPGLNIHSANVDIASSGIPVSGMHGGGGVTGSSSGGGPASFRVGSPSSGSSTDQTEVIRRWNLEVSGAGGRPISMSSSFTNQPPGQQGGRGGGSSTTIGGTTPGGPLGNISPESAVSASTLIPNEQHHQTVNNH